MSAAQIRRVRAVLKCPEVLGRDGLQGQIQRVSGFAKATLGAIISVVQFSCSSTRLSLPSQQHASNRSLSITSSCSLLTLIPPFLEPLAVLNKAFSNGPLHYRTRSFNRRTRELPGLPHAHSSPNPQGSPPNPLRTCCRRSQLNPPFPTRGRSSHAKRHLTTFTQLR